MTAEPIDGEFVGRELVVSSAPVPAPTTLYGTDDPTAIVRSATAQADVLAEVVKSRGLTTKISGRDYVRIEGWTLLGTMLGVYAEVVWSRPIDDGNGWEARVEARRSNGAIVGAAEAQCSRDESTWKTRPEYAIRSMAQTRAAAKCLRMALGFVMALAGFEATPAEEMGDDDRAEAPRRDSAAPRPAPAQSATRQRQQPTPPQPRTAPPRQGAPSKQQPAPADNARYPWRHELGLYAEAQGVTIPMMSAFLGVEASVGNIDEWLRGAEGRTVQMLVDDAKALAGEETAIESGEVSGDDRPF